MPNWNHRVKLKHLFTDKEDHASIQASMNAIADVVKSTPCFARFSVAKFSTIPQGDDVVGPVDYSNKLLSRLYDYADENRIWIE